MNRKNFTLQIKITKIMETDQTLVHTGNGEKEKQHGCSKRSNAKVQVSSNEEKITKRKKNDVLVAATDLNRDDAISCINKKVVGKILTIDDIPSEVLGAILCNVTTSDLVSCRQMNRKWNEISTSIMRRRADIQIIFKLYREGLGQLIQRIPTQTLLKDFFPMINEDRSLSLSDLVKCIELSTNFPFTNFRFKDVVKIDDVKSFLSIWGENISSIAVKIEIVEDVETLRALLQHTSNLKKLHIDFGMIHFHTQKMETAVHLFADSNEFKLAELNALRVTGSCKYFAGIIADIVKVASNLNCFEKCSLDENGTSECIDAEELAMLQSLNKLHCLKDVNLLFKKEIINLLDKFPQIMDLRLKSFELSITWIWDDSQLSARATKIINKIFDSSKNSLLELKIPPLGLLSGLVIPIFKNLLELHLSHDESYEDDPGPSMFPPSFDMAVHFPNLQELSVAFLTEDDYFSLYRPLNVMPKVELLRIVFETEYDVTLMKLTPNVKTLLIGGTHDKPPSMNFKEIAKHLKTLENLGWHIIAESQQNLQSSCILDSIITGFSKTFCKKMSAQFRNQDDLHLPQQTVASYEKYRKKFSILNLRELKRFDMSFLLRRDSYSRFDFNSMCSCESNCECDTDDDENPDKAGFYQDNYFYKSPLTKVSQLLAFDLKPNLDVNIISRYLP